MIGCVGDDDFGRAQHRAAAARRRRRLGDRGRPERPTGSAFVRYRADGARDFVYNIRHSASGAIAPDRRRRRADRRRRPPARHGHGAVSPALAGDGPRRARTRAAARRHGLLRPQPAQGDAGGARACARRSSDVLSQTDLFLPSGDELFLFSDATDEAAAAARAPRPRHPHRRRQERRRRARSTTTPAARCAAPAFAVEEVDPTGAGDTFGATFVTCWLRGLPPARGADPRQRRRRPRGRAAGADGGHLHPGRTRRLPRRQTAKDAA